MSLALCRPGNSYHSAAQCFVQVTSDIQGHFSDVSPFFALSVEKAAVAQVQLSGRWECRAFPLSCLAVCLCSALHGFPREQVLSGGDIATYGSICALASFSRKELKDSLLNNVEFKKLADTHAPQWKTIVQQFYNSNYAKVFEMLEAIKVGA